MDEEDPVIIKAYYELRKREDEFAEEEVKKILKDYRVNSLQF